MELQQLKDIAAKVGYKYHHMTGAAKLEEGLRAYCIEIGTSLEEVASELSGVEGEDTGNKVETPEDVTPEDVTPTEQPHTIEPKLPSKDSSVSMVEKLSKMTFAQAEKETSKKVTGNRAKEAMRLIRCIITCNNKNKTSYTGEIFCARNAVVPEVKKFIPFGVPTHIPKILFNMIKEKQYQQFKTKKVNGNTVKESFMVAEYNIQLLDPISAEEFNAIKQKQLAEGFNGE